MLCCLGWAIRGWNDQEGASRLKALFDVVPKGQWIVSDMDVDGIWRYFGNYSFFGAPFIWTTLHGTISWHTRARARAHTHKHTHEGQGALYVSLM